MSDRPTEPFAPPSAEPGELPARSLSEILSELAMISHAQQGEASEMRNAVSELSRALARLFEMIRTDRHDQRARIEELERELASAKDQLAKLGVDAVVAPAPNDFDQLRAAAERLRVRTAQLVRESVTAERAAAAAAEDEAADVELGPSVSEADESNAIVLDAPVEWDAPVEPEVPVEFDAPVGLGGPVLRVLPGNGDAEPAVAGDVDLDVESELPLAQAEAIALPVAPPASVAVSEAPPAPEPPASEPEPASAPETAEPAPAESETAIAQQPVGAPAVPRGANRAEPIAVAARLARKRGLRPRRRRIDARKLVDVEPAAALGSMVSAVNQLWTAGCSIDLVVAFTDGGALRVAGGDRVPLRVEEVEPGTRARCTVTATRRQLVPLFGRLDLTGDESAPLIHGSRRDADLLVGWFDRAQRLAVEPL